MGRSLVGYSPRVAKSRTRLSGFTFTFPGRSSVPTSFVSLFVFYIFFYLLSKTMGCFSGCLMSSAGIQKLFCGIYSAFKCSFDEFVGEKVVSPSYSSAILGLPPFSLISAVVIPSIFFFYYILYVPKAFLHFICVYLPISHDCSLYIFYV